MRRLVHRLIRTLNERQQALAADKVVDLGHVVCGALVIGQLVSSEKWSWGLCALGVAFQFVCYCVARELTEDSR